MFSMTQGILFDEGSVATTVDGALVIMKKAFHREIDVGVANGALRLFREGRADALFVCGRVFWLHERWRSALDCFLFLESTPDVLEFANAAFAAGKYSYAASAFAIHGDEKVFRDAFTRLPDTLREENTVVMDFAYRKAKADRAGIDLLAVPEISPAYQVEIEGYLEMV